MFQDIRKLVSFHNDDLEFNIRRRLVRWNTLTFLNFIANFFQTKDIFSLDMILHCFTERMHTNMIEKLVADSTGIEFVNFETEETLIDYMIIILISNIRVVNTT